MHKTMAATGNKSANKTRHFRDVKEIGFNNGKEMKLSGKSNYL
jgi:hypothetical protein